MSRTLVMIGVGVLLAVLALSVSRVVGYQQMSQESLLRISDDEFRSMAIKRLDPAYPALAKAAGVGGAVIVELTVDEQGKVVSTRVISGHSLLRQAVMSAAQNWEFKPAKVNGIAVKMIGRISFDFVSETTDYEKNKEIAIYEKQAKATPTSAELQYRLGKAYTNQGRYVEAIAAYKRAIVIKPEFFAALLELAEVCYKQDSYEEAIAAYRRVLAIKPDFSEAEVLLAWSFEQLHRYDDALSVWRHILSLNPSLHDEQVAYINIASIYKDKGEIDQAIDAYKKLIFVGKELNAIEPDSVTSPDVYAKEMASLYEQSGRLAQAIEAHKEAMVLAPSSPFVPQEYCEIGRLYEQMGRSDEAIDSYQKAIALHPEYAKPHFILGLLYVNLKSKGLALREYETLKKLDAKMASELLSSIREKLPAQ